MSWISGLADKAENILNKIDQNAATALQSPDSEPSGSSFSNSTQSLKPTLSPTKHTRITLTGNAKINCEGPVIAIEDSIESANNLDCSAHTEIATSSRKSSISSKADSVAIDLGIIENESNSTSAQSVKEVGQELAAFKIALSEVSSERDELRCRLATLNRDIENAGLEQRAQELELLVQRLTEERDQVQKELIDTQRASSAYVHSMSELETNLAKLKQIYLETLQKLQVQTKESEQHRQDLDEYRTKAQRALQLKDRLIKELKTNSPVPDTIESQSDSFEVDTLKQQNKQLYQENLILSANLDESQHDLNSLKKIHIEHLATIRSNEELLQLERERSFATEAKHRNLNQELDTLRLQLTDTAKTLQETEAQLQQLRAGRKNIDNTDALVEEYDARLRTLTKALVAKQSAVESITTERNALRIQLEKVQDRWQQSKHINESLPRNALLSNSTDDAKAQFPMLLKETPFDNHMARRFKRAYSSLDSAGIRLGAFLRRYPLMRIFVLMYVGLLHIWVVLVLFLSTPN